MKAENERTSKCSAKPLFTFALVMLISLTITLFWMDVRISNLLTSFSKLHFRPIHPNITEEQVMITLDILEKNVRTLRQNWTVPEVTSSEQNMILLVTTWRSGSTFLSEILASHPNVFIHYEPFWHQGVVQIRQGPKAQEALEHLKRLQHCEFTNPDYNHVINIEMEGLMRNNLHCWNACIQGPNRRVCSEPMYLERACVTFPTLVSKIVRLRLNLTRQLLQDRQMKNLKIIYLVRDPRATLHSRLKTGWCNTPDCNDPGRLCDDITSDVNAFDQLANDFPGRLLLVRYEALAEQPRSQFRHIYHFCGLPMLPSIEKIIDEHTTNQKEDGTYRKSAERINRWKTGLNRSQIDQIQSVCRPTLNLLGYPLI